VIRSRVFREEQVSDFAWWWVCLLAGDAVIGIAWGLGSTGLVLPLAMGVLPAFGGMKRPPVEAAYITPDLRHSHALVRATAILPGFGGNGKAAGEPEALICWFGCEEKNGKARVPQVRSGYCAEAPVRYRSYTSRPAISEVVTRDGPELYNRGDRSSMTAFGAVLVVELHRLVSLAWVSRCWVFAAGRGNDRKGPAQSPDSAP